MNTAAAQLATKQDLINLKNEIVTEVIGQVSNLLLEMMEVINARFDKIEARLDRIEADIKLMKHDIQGLKLAHINFEQKLDPLIESHADLGIRVHKLEQRMA